ncbi:MAG: hypothetical protein U1E01_15210 [Methylicorpusculum sp.]|nr:hypothetical protein [Methylicorpusculum sp.]
MKAKRVYSYALILSVFGLLYSLITANTYATTLFPVERTCPVGGQKYRSVEIGSTSRFGMRLDLRPIGPAAHLPWAECPNGFVVFKDFTKDEIAKLTPIVAGAEYQRMRKEHTTAYRVVYLRRSLGESDTDLSWLILKAAWGAEDRKMEKLRQQYLEEAYNAFIAQANTLVTHDDEWWSASILAAEIERQRHHFNESITLLEALPVSELPSDDLKHALISQIKGHAVKGDPKPTDYKRD